MQIIKESQKIFASIKNINQSSESRKQIVAHYLLTRIISVVSWVSLFSLSIACKINMITNLKSIIISIKHINE